MENQDSNLENKFEHIKGWGIDADPENEPTYPMKKYTGDDHNRLNYERPPLQQIDIEVLHSNERPNVTAVFGTATPPKGLSGMIRRYAFKHSESSYRHWLPLLFADRVNVMEGYIDDFIHGKVPNLIKEHGWNAEWKHDKAGMITKVSVAAIVASSIFFIFRKK